MTFKSIQRNDMPNFHWFMNRFDLRNLTKLHTNILGVIKMIFFVWYVMNSLHLLILIFEYQTFECEVSLSTCEVNFLRSYLSNFTWRVHAQLVLQSHPFKCLTFPATQAHMFAFGDPGVGAKIAYLLRPFQMHTLFTPTPREGLNLGFLSF